MTMCCPDRGDLIHAYLDGELELTASMELEEHLATCAHCRAAADEARALRRVLATADPRFVPDPRLTTRIASALGTTSTPPTSAPAAVSETPAARVRRPSVFRPLRWGLGGTAAGLAVAAAVAALVLPTLTRRDQLADELLASHVRSLMVDHLTDVASSDQHTVRPWFDGKLDFSPPVRDFADEGFPLVGGRLDYVGGRAVAALAYRRHQHVINVFVWPDAGRKELGPIHDRQGYRFAGWNAEGMRWVAVSDLNATELGELVALIQRDAH